ncbi:CYTH and CHAD domain-containing protein [Cellulosimicrobium sp. CUA-896]|uniref:CYTH and CHAD domain-containing protein n=1 Tax=Cellulosimicrobium sp. CUA-896 TaxID=1517881 RepID=UPI000959FD5D|nr:CYTH and CHAD domain-containing protein [Cellulosimicrobium sp. CUA-896]OLT53052.1 hypothetical protein BJF88_01270 [Cellulosimicrobium sp. CUA-896]
MTHLERERTLSAPAGWSMPAIDVTGARGETGDPLHLDALYYDTADLRLLARGVTLRRRTGGEDAGWHLKLPAPGDAREELRRPLDADAEPLPPVLGDPGDAPAPPAELAGLVLGLTRAAPLVPVGRVRTERTTTLLRATDDDAPLVEVAEDRVTAERIPPPGARERPTNADPHAGGGTDAWREIEVELAPAGLEQDDPEALLAAVVDALVTAGASAEPSRPKLARALGVDSTPGPSAAAGDAAPDRAGATTAGDVVTAYLAEQVDALVRWDPEVRRDTPDAVHKARVAARRLRSALATFRPLLDREQTDPARDELRWWGQVLGEARDAEVARDRVHAVLDRLPDELVVGPVRARVVDELDARYREAHRTAVEQMSGRRYLDLLESLAALAAAPPLTGRAGDPATDVLPALARKTWKRTRRRARAAAGAEGARRDDLLHDVRKAAKRARYAGESMAGAVGKDAARFARRLEDVQDALGDHHDAVALAHALRGLGMQANLSGENGFSYGLLVGIERERADEALAEYDDAWSRARRRRHRRWTRT